jgi:hypothetical protein
MTAEKVIRLTPRIYAFVVMVLNHEIYCPNPRKGETMFSPLPVLSKAFVSKGAVANGVFIP